MAAECIFCRIASGVMGVPLLHDDGAGVPADQQCVAFRDIAPQAPTHVLVIPKRHVASLAATSPDDDALLGHVLAVARKVALELGLSGSGYRVVLNTGADGGQSVPHLHAHVLGGRALGWPPG
jgi:histidine triad (HIT) family protein